MVIAAENPKQARELANDSSMDMDEQYFDLETGEDRREKNNIWLK